MTTLPMDDVILHAKLDVAGLFHGNLKDKVTAKSTSVEMAECYLDKGINGSKKFFLYYLK